VVQKFGSKYAERLRRKHQGYVDTFLIDEVFVKIHGKQHYLWRAVGQAGEMVDVSVQKRPDGKVTKRFFNSLLRKHKGEPHKIFTDKLRSYNVAHRELIPATIHYTTQFANNRAELSREPTWVSERCIRKFESVVQAQRFLSAHAALYNLLNLGRHLVSAESYRFFRQRAFASWEKVAAIYQLKIAVFLYSKS
jgi:putative transposase